MRRFIVEVVIDTVLLAVIVLFLGIISVAQPFPFGPGSAPIVALRGAGIVGFASWAAILVLVNRFARPVLVALFGRLLYSTLGLFVVVINALAIWLTSVIAPIKIGTVADPVILWIIVAAALYTALSTVAEAVLGLNRPDLTADRSRGIWGFLERAANAAPERDHREPPPPAGLQRDLHDEPRHRAGRDPGRRRAALVRAPRAGRDRRHHR